MLTNSDNDHEALNALRTAQKLMKAEGVTFLDASFGTVKFPKYQEPQKEREYKAPSFADIAEENRKIETLFNRAEKIIYNDKNEKDFNLIKLKFSSAKFKFGITGFLSVEDELWLENIIGNYESQ